MTSTRALTTILVFLFFNVPAYAQQKYPSTFLWRISGKDLSKPSYLYGTMHVQDRRLFYFGDSLYNALEKTEGFAMEINPDEMMDSLFKSMSKKDTSALLRKILNENEYKKIAKKLEKKLNMPADRITTKRLAEERRRWNKESAKKDDMPTIMDLYLFSLARKQGKYTGGIEDIADQFEIADEIGTFKIDDFIKDDTTRRISYLEQMKQVYISRDLSGINMMMNGGLKEQFEDLLMVKRNHKMAIRIDSLANTRSSFFAIGAAHLPGDSGVISLLKRRGFTVEPVFSSAFIAPGAYKYTAKELPWQKVEDENKMCSVLMPGMPTAMLAQETLPMKMYMDMGDMCVYGIAVAPITSEEAKSDTFFNRFVEYYKKNDFEVKNVKNIEYKNCKGIEMYAIQKGEAEFRFRLLLKENKLFIVIFGGKDKDGLYDVNAEKFLNSLSFNEENIAGQKKEWQLFTSDKNAFSMMAPGKTVEGTEEDTEGVAYDKYTSIDYTDGSYYMVLIRDTRPGYYIESDSFYFDEYKKNLNLLTGDKVKDFSTVKFKNYNACHFTAVQTISGHDILMEGYLIRRGNRTYIPMVVMPTEKADFPEITNFFRSFTPLPYKKTEWRRRSLGDTDISTNAPGVFKRTQEDTTGYQYNANLLKYNVQDKNNAATYSAEIEYLSPYYWCNSDTAFFRGKANSFTGYNDSLIAYQYVNAPVRSAEVLVRLSGSPVYKKLKFFLNGDTVYTFYTYQNEDALNDDQAKSFFSGIQFLHQYPSSIFDSKAAKLLEALASNDSATVARARTILKDVAFTKADMPLLQEALLKKYKKYESEYRSVNEALADKIIELDDSSVVEFVNKHYHIKNEAPDDMQMLMLEMLGKNKTTSSYALLRQLLLNNPPREGNIFTLVYSISDSLELMKGFFPAATALYADTTVGAGIVNLANELADSNLVSAADILQNENGLISLAKKQYGQLKKDKDKYPPYNAEIIVLLRRFNSKQSNEMLNGFLTLPVMWVKNNAILALLKNDQPVAAAETRKFAADKEWRTGFYQSLKEIQKTSLFPKEFYTQLKFSESYVYNSMSEDYEVEVKSIQFIKERTAEINGKLKRFYLYKMILDDEDDKTPRLVICGAFDMDKNIAEIKEDDLEVYYNYDDEFVSSKADEQFNKYIADKIKNKKEE